MLSAETDTETEDISDVCDEESVLQERVENQRLVCRHVLQKAEFRVQCSYFHRR